MIRWALAVLLLAAPAWAGSFTITTTPEQDRALAARATREGITVEALVRGHVLNGLVNPARAALEQQRERTYREKLDALPPATRARVLQELGVSE